MGEKSISNSLAVESRFFSTNPAGKVKQNVSSKFRPIDEHGVLKTAPLRRHSLMLLLPKVRVKTNLEQSVDKIFAGQVLVGKHSLYPDVIPDWHFLHKRL